jgi:hypothetical protein
MFSISVLWSFANSLRRLKHSALGYILSPLTRLSDIALMQLGDGGYAFSLVLILMTPLPVGCSPYTYPFKAFMCFVMRMVI